MYAMIAKGTTAQQINSEMGIPVEEAQKILDMKQPIKIGVQVKTNSNQYFVDGTHWRIDETGGLFIIRASLADFRDYTETLNTKD